MKEVFKRHYKTIVNRGLITPETQATDFIKKLIEEVNELQDACNREDAIQEAIDCICVLTNMLIHHEVDIEFVRNREAHAHQVQ